MITVTLKRNRPQGKAVTGVITLPFEEPLNYPTLENADFIIPAGTYPLEMTWSPKFKKLLPEILEVPDREGIRIHMGTLPEHSTGCVLTNPHAMANLKILFNRVEQINEFKNENEEDEKVCIEISDPACGA